MHGTTMIFLVVVPILAGFAQLPRAADDRGEGHGLPAPQRPLVLAVPARRDRSVAELLRQGRRARTPAGGRTRRCRRTSRGRAPATARTTGSSALHILTLSSLLGAINFIVTIHNMRAPGMTWMRMPLFVWAIETYAILLLVALPAISAAVTLLLLDRTVGTHFFIPSQGGSIVLYQHMFWFFGHPEVYIMVLPVFGMISEIMPVFSRKPIFGYKAVAFSTLAIAFLSLLVWAHHMFTTGLGDGLRLVLHDLVDGDRDPDRDQDLQLARHDLARQPHLRHADAVRARLHRAVHDRRPVGDLPRSLPRRLAAERLVLRRRALPLRPVRRLGLRLLRRPVLLVAEDVRAPARRAARQVALLADVRWLQPHLPAAAHARAARDGAAHLHVPPRRPVGGLQPHLHGRLRRDGALDRDLPRQRLAHTGGAQGRARRQRPVARRHARVVHDLAAAAGELRQRALRDESRGRCATCVGGSRRRRREDRAGTRALAAPVGAGRGGRDAARGRLRGRGPRYGAPAARRARGSAAGGAHRLGLVCAPAARAGDACGCGSVRGGRGGSGAACALRPGRVRARCARDRRGRELPGRRMSPGAHGATTSR